MNKKNLLLDKKFLNISNFFEFKEDFKNFETLEKKYNKLYNNMLFIMIHKQIEKNDNKIEAVCKGNGTLREIKLYKLVSNLRIVPSSYAESLSNHEKWKEFHLKTASKGSSEIPPNMEDVKHHYVAFIIKDKKLYELDGRLNKPYCHKKIGEINREDLLDKVIEIVKKRLANKEMNDLFSIMFLEKK